MSTPLFSQVPLHILSKVEGPTFVKGSRPKKRVKFVVEDSSDESSDNTIEEVDVESSNEPSSSLSNQQVTSNVNREDAITQTDDLITKTRVVDQETQTDESLITRPLCETDDDIQRYHRLTHSDLNAFKPLYSFPRKRGADPPLKLGLTLPKGKKRKVYYPGNPDINDRD